MRLSQRKFGVFFIKPFGALLFNFAVIAASGLAAAVDTAAWTSHNFKHLELRFAVFDFLN